MSSPTQLKKRTASRSKRFVFAALAVTLSVTIFCAAMEIVLRRIHALENRFMTDAHGAPIYRVDPVLRYALKPSEEAPLRRLEFSVTVKTNSFGYRDDEFADPPDPNQFVIAGLGDSFAMGHGVEVEDCFYQVAERSLQRDFPGVRIDNMGVHGYSQIQHVHQIELAKRLGAKIVVIAACTYNDVLENDDILTRNVRADGWRQDTNEDRPFDMPTEAPKEEGWLYNHSDFVRFAVSRLQISHPNLDLRGGASWYLLDQTREHPDPRTQQAFDKTEALLDSIREQCDRAGMKPAVVTIPVAWECSDKRFKSVLSHYGLTGEGMNRRHVTDFYKDYCQEHGVPCLDLAEVFEKNTNHPETLFYPLDLHFNKKGHLLAGEKIAEFLKPLVIEGSSDRRGPPKSTSEGGGR